MNSDHPSGGGGAFRYSTAAFSENSVNVGRRRHKKKRRRRKSRRRRSIGPVTGGAERSRWTFEDGGRAPASAVAERGARPRGGAPGVRRGDRRLRARFRVGGEISVATREPDLAGARQGHGTRRGRAARHRAPRVTAFPFWLARARFRDSPPPPADPNPPRLLSSRPSHARRA